MTPKKRTAKNKTKDSTSSDVSGDANPRSSKRGTNAEPRPTGGSKTIVDTVDVFKGFAKTTAHLVQQAASILEEELAAGIKATKMVEERFLNVNELRSGEKEEVFQRFRRDAHELVDILIDVVGTTSKSMGNLAKRIVSIRSEDQLAKGGGSGRTQTIRPTEPVKVGESTNVIMTVNNDTDEHLASFRFHSSELVSIQGDRIPSTAVHFNPTTLKLEPHRSEKVTVTIKVPAQAPKGVYSGFIQATNLEQLRVVLTVQVISS